MKPQFQHDATSSFALWLDHYLVHCGEAYSNKQGELYYMPDERLPMYPDDPVNGLVSYNSEYKQWVYDSDITGAVIPSGVYIDTGDGAYNFCERGQSGLSLDFENGRVLFDGIFFPTNYADLRISGDFSVKDINIYLADDTEENLVIQNKYNLETASLIMIDCDLYSSTRDALTFCKSLMKDITIIIFDDWLPGLEKQNLGEKKAFEEFMDNNKDLKSSLFRDYLPLHHRRLTPLR